MDETPNQPGTTLAYKKKKIVSISAEKSRKNNALTSLRISGGRNAFLNTVHNNITSKRGVIR